jgi:ferritin-like metal-binding protein YciE
MRSQKSSGGSAVAETEMENEFLHEPFVEGLKDIYDAEKQLLKAIPKLEKAATDPALKEALSNHLRETEGQVKRLERVFESIDEPAKSKTCAAMKGLVEEGGEATKEKDTKGRDACIIAAAQKVEHYEIATYGTLRAWAESMGHDEAAGLLEETLEEEKAADVTLSEVADGECGCEGRKDEDEEDEA